MQNTLILYKPVGHTPLQTIIVFQEKFPEYRTLKLSYAGRLDPMAEGLLLILVGDENKKRKRYESLQKTYEFSVLFGITTDSYDLLGLPELHKTTPLTIEQHTLIDEFCKTKIGPQKQYYPPFSSKTVKGKPLYYWAREGRLNEIIIPAKDVTIFSLIIRSFATITPEDITQRISTFPSLRSGEFRQEIILARWQKLLARNTTACFSLATFSLTCSSGTYVRSFAQEMGRYTETGALAFSITRTNIGSYTTADAHHV